MLGWSQRGLAAYTQAHGTPGWSEGTVRRWMRDPDANPPEELDEWLWRRAQAMRDDPPPPRTVIEHDEDVEQLGLTLDDI